MKLFAAFEWCTNIEFTILQHWESIYCYVLGILEKKNCVWLGTGVIKKALPVILRKFSVKKGWNYTLVSTVNELWKSNSTVLFYFFPNLFFQQTGKAHHSRDETLKPEDFIYKPHTYQNEYHTAPTQSCAQKHNQSVTKWPVRKEFLLIYQCCQIVPTCSHTPKKKKKREINLKCTISTLSHVYK